MYIKKRRLGRGVAIVGAGVSKFGSFSDKTSRDLFIEAFSELKQSVDRGINPKDIEALYLGNHIGEYCEGQSLMAPIIAGYLGMIPKPATRVENACVSSGVALREGIIAIASGLYDIVLVGGVEKMTTLSTEGVTDALGSALDALYETPAGFTFPGIYAAMATTYMDKYGAKEEHFMKVAIKNHNNGALNPKAQFNITIKDIMNGRIAKAKQKGQPIPTWVDEMEFLKDPKANPAVAWPMKLFDCSPITDGASCLLLVAEEVAKSFTETPVYVIGTGQGSDYPLYEREDMTTILAAKFAAQEAYAMAGVKPEDIQIAEVHDCFTIAELVGIEDIGFFSPGGAIRAVEEGITARDGAKPINTSGGLKSKGHPVGATGTAQAAEIWLQMRGQAGARQVPDKDISLALTHNVGGSGPTCAVHIYERR